MMDRTILFACLALLVVAEVQSYTLRDALRNRLRERELNRLREYRTFDANPVSDAESLRVLNRLREFHLSQMLLDEAQGNGKECKDVRPDCESAKDAHLCDEKFGHIKEWVDENCRRTCNVNNCRGAAAQKIKPPAPQQPTCKDLLPNNECSDFNNFCHDTYHMAIADYMNEYCDRTCNRKLGLC